jgi:AcrR family transcriptional regulator
METTDQRASYHHGDLRRALIAAAVEMVEQVGPEAFTLREVARRIGVSHAAPYRHFKTRHEVLVAVAAAGFERLGARMQAALEDSDDPLAGFKRCAGAYFGFAVENPQQFKLMFGTAVDRDEIGAVRQRADRVFDAMAALLEEAQQQGRIRPGDAADFTRIAWSLVHGICLLHLNGQYQSPVREDVAALVDRALADLIAGLAAPSCS